jgi:hypothetical protein
MKTHTYFVTKTAVWLLMLSPILGLTALFLGAWLTGQLTD